MRKILSFILLSFVSISALSEPKIEQILKDGNYLLNISYPDKEKWNKVLALSSSIDMLFISRISDERKYLKCYNSFQLLVDNIFLKPEQIEFESNGSRMYIEDIDGISEDTINALRNEPKKYDEKFTLDLSNKNIKQLLNAKSISLKICDETDDFSEEEINAIKKVINTAKGRK